MITNRALTRATTKEFIDTATRFCDVYWNISQISSVKGKISEKEQNISRLKEIVENPRFFNYTSPYKLSSEETKDIDQHFTNSIYVVSSLKIHCRVHMRNLRYAHPEHIKLIHDTIVHKLFCDTAIKSHKKYIIYMKHFLEELKSHSFKQAIIDIGFYPEIEYQIAEYDLMMHYIGERDKRREEIKAWSNEFKHYRQEAQNIIINLQELMINDNSV
mgnify:CR=1 FL=1